MGNHTAPPEPSSQPPLKQLLWLLIVGLAVFAFFSTQVPTSQQTQTVISYSAIKELIRDGDVIEATLFLLIVSATRPIAPQARRPQAARRMSPSVEPRAPAMRCISL